MKHKFLNYSPRIIAVILLTAIAILMVLIANNGGLNLFKVGTPGEAGSNIPNPPPIIPEEKPDVSPKLDLTIFPKASVKHSIYNYSQEVVGKSSVDLMMVHQTSQETYVIASSASQNGDIARVKVGVSILNIDLSGNIIASYNLPDNTIYLTSQITTEGLAVICNIDKMTYLYIVDYDFKNTKTIQLDYTSNAMIFVMTDSFIVTIGGEKSNVMLIADSEIKHQFPLKKSLIISIVGLSDFFMICHNTEDGYNITFLNQDFKEYSSINQPNKKLLSILPIEENGQKFVVLETNNANISQLVKYDKSFNSKNAVISPLKIDSDTKLYQYDKTIVALQAKDEKAIILDHELNAINDNTAFKNIGYIFECIKYEDGYIVLTTLKSNEQLALVYIRTDGSTETKKMLESSQKAFAYKKVDSSIDIIFSSFVDNKTLVRLFNCN